MSNMVPLMYITESQVVLTIIQWNFPCTNREYFKRDVHHTSTSRTGPWLVQLLNPWFWVACLPCVWLLSAGKFGHLVHAICKRKFLLTYTTRNWQVPKALQFQQQIQRLNKFIQVCKNWSQFIVSSLTQQSFYFNIHYKAQWLHGDYHCDDAVTSATHWLSDSDWISTTLGPICKSGY